MNLRFTLTAITFAIAGPIFFTSCKKELKTTALTLPIESKLSSLNGNSSLTTDYCWDDEENGLQPDSVLKPTILGTRLIGTPYSVAKMQQASINLTGSSIGIAENKKYVRFKPADYNQLAILEDLDIDLFDYPLDYELVQEGDYYDDGVTPVEQIPWLYAVVDVGFVFPTGITYEILQSMHVPNDYRIENEAFRITGNNVDTAGCTGGAALANAASSQSCDCSVRESALSCNCKIVCGYDPCRTPLPPIPITRIPAGNITVMDDTRGQLVGLRNVRLVARRFLKVDRTYTDNIGNYAFTKSFRNKFTMLMKFKNNNAIISGLKGARLWQMLFPVKINMGRYRGNVNNVKYNVKDNNEINSRGALDWATATAHNAVQEYLLDRAPTEGIGLPPNKLRILTLPGNGSGSAPMFAKRFFSSVSNFYYRQFIVPAIGGEYATSYLNAVASVLAARLDVIIQYNGGGITKSADHMSELCYHEYTHAAHYNKVGNSWYGNFVQAEVNQIIVNLNGNFSPYGQNNSADAPLIALGESWAYHIGHFFTNRKYGALSGLFIEQGESYTNNIPADGLNSNLNLLEDFDPINRRAADPFWWIPQGIYYDLIDNRNDNGVPLPRVALNDNVFSYTNQQFFNALDADINNLQAYRARLLSENANRDAAGVITIFNFYGY